MRGHLSRRDFLHVTSGASVGAAFLGHGAFEGAGEPASAQRLTGMEGWFDRPMRWVQLTLVENDPGRFDPAVLARLLPPPARGRRHASAPAASSPTTRPRCRCTTAAPGSATPIRSARSSRGCRALGMQVVARTDPHAARDEVRAAHPGLDCRRRATGSRAATGRTRSCGSRARLGPYNFEFMDQVHREIVDEVQRRRHLRRTAGRRRAATATACTASENFKAATGAGPAAHCRPPRSGAARSSSSGARRG